MTRRRGVLGRTSDRSRTGARSALIVALVSVLAGCVFPQADGQDRAQVADDVLFAEVAQIPGVVQATTSYGEAFGASSGYFADLVIDETADPLCVLDQASAILWQGRTLVAFNVGVVRGEESWTLRELGLGSGSIRVEYTERYGPQRDSAAFVEPETPPACR